MSGFKGSTALRISILDHTRRRTAVRCGQAIILVVVFFALLPNYSAEACTIFMASKEGKTLVGNNEDWVDPASHVWFIPASEGRYGRVYFGFGTELPQGGMNEQGLFMDFAAVPYRPYSFSPNKPQFPGYLLEKLMEKCATVEEALQLLSAYDVPLLSRTQLMLVDRTGASAIVEKDKTIRRTKYYQVVTNFRQSENEPNPYSIERYNLAETTLRAGDVSIDQFQTTLAATHQEEGSPTQYSNIYDLTTGEIYVYHFHNYQIVAKLNLKNELRKGAHSYEIRALFPWTTFAAAKYYDENKRKDRTAIQVDPGVFNGLAGKYMASPDLVVTISRKQSRLYCQLTGTADFEIFPESELKYFLTALDMQIEFNKSLDGKVDSLSFQFAGQSTPARRTE